MKILFYLYFSLASLVPKNALYGKWQAACIWLFILKILLFIGIYAFFQKLTHYKPENAKLYAYLVFGVMGLFLFVILRIIILKPVKLIQLKKKYNKIPKWKLQLSGILYILFCFIVGLGLGIFST